MLIFEKVQNLCPRQMPLTFPKKILLPALSKTEKTHFRTFSNCLLLRFRSSFTMAR